jgi:HAD superfamily hydrolase (TIGR01509 family)
VASVSIEAVVFDLGGVLIRLEGVPVMGRLAGGLAEEEVWRRWLACPWVRRYERGQCSRGEFAAGLIQDWGLSIGSEEFLASFLRWPRGLYPGADRLLAALSGRVHRACLSNTNELHWESQLGADRLRELFDSTFLSFELGLIKPDREIFEHVVAELGCPAGAVLFLDDNRINVEAARAVGIDAHRVQGSDAARDLLRARGVLGAR